MKSTNKTKKVLLEIAWFLSPIAPYVVGVLIGCIVMIRTFLPPSVTHALEYSIAAIIFSLIMLMPISIFIEPDTSSYWYKRRIAKNRAKLAKVGLTPEQYLKTLPMDDSRGRVKAMMDFGIEA